MALLIAVSATGGREVSAELLRIERSVPPVRWHKVWGQKVAMATRRNARRKGGRKFWNEIASATQLDAVSSVGAMVGIWHVAAGHKQSGGTIRPKNVKYLTIPLTEEAEGKRASDFEEGGRELFVVRRNEGSGSAVLGYMAGDQFVGLYVLKRSVTQAAQPFLPSNDEIGAIGVDEGLRLLESTP